MAGRRVLRGWCTRGSWKRLLLLPSWLLYGLLMEQIDESSEARRRRRKLAYRFRFPGSICEEVRLVWFVLLGSHQRFALLQKIVPLSRAVLMRFDGVWPMDYRRREFGVGIVGESESSLLFCRQSRRGRPRSSSGGQKLQLYGLHISVPSVPLQEIRTR